MSLVPSERLVAPAERRLKKIRLSTDLLLSTVLNPRIAGDQAAFFTLDGLPVNCHVRAAYYDAAIDSFYLHLFHPSFPELPAGEEPPDLEITIRMEYRRLADAPARGREFL